MKSFFISPHFDDVALSCGGILRGRIAAGHDVTVVSLFTRDTNRTYTARRAAEDHAACRLVGAARIDLGFDDAPGLARTFTALCLAGKVDAAYAKTVAAAIGRVADGADELWFPLAIGGHIDHRTAFSASRLLRRTTIRYYEDRPYALVGPLRHLRLRELRGGAAIVRPPSWILARFDEASCGGLMVDDERAAVAAELSRRLARPAPAKFALRATKHAFDGDLAMARAYKSQIRALFGGADPADVWPDHETSTTLQ